MGDVKKLVKPKEPKKGFTMLVHGEFWQNKDPHTAIGLWTVALKCPISLKKAKKSTKARDKVIRILGEQLLIRAEESSSSLKRWLASAEMEKRKASITVAAPKPVKEDKRDKKQAAREKMKRLENKLDKKVVK